jgi:hypothetical protein
MVSSVDKVALAIEEAAFERRTERVVPRGYAVFGVLRTVVPGVVFRITGGSGGNAFATTPGSASDD